MHAYIQRRLGRYGRTTYASPATSAEVTNTPRAGRRASRNAAGIATETFPHESRDWKVPISVLEYPWTFSHRVRNVHVTAWAAPMNAEPYR